MIRLRQIALITSDLERARADIFGLFGVRSAFEDPAVREFGLRNFIVTLGDTFVEVLSPIQANSAGAHFLERHGDSGYMLIVQTDDWVGASERINRLGIRKTWEIHVQNAHAFHMHPKDTGGTLLSLDQMEPGDSWAWAGPGWADRAASNVGLITAVDVLAPNPKGVAKLWEQIFEREAQEVRNEWSIDLDLGTIRIRQGSAESGYGIRGIEVRAVDEAAVRSGAAQQGLATAGNMVRVCGVHFQFKGAVAASGIQA